MKYQFVKSGVKANNLLIFYTQEAWKKENGRLKGAVGKDFSGKPGELAGDYDTMGFKRVILAGLGEAKELDLEAFRRSANAFGVAAKRFKIKALQVDLTRGHSMKSDYLENAVLEGLMLGQYAFLKYKKKEEKKDVKVDKVFFKSRGKPQNLDRTIGLVENAMMVRDLVNTSSDEMNPQAMERTARRVAKEAGLKVRVAADKKLGLLQAVGRGSRFKPRLVFLEYRGAGKGKPLIALLGKGITFDSGGYNLKPTGYMEDMRMDMAGAATVLGIMKSLAELRVKKNVLGVMALAENMIGSKAYKPGDVFSAYDGTTVEVKNTDAEGRLVLADASTYTVKNFKPDFMIDLATLTGSCLVCLGELAAAIISNDDVKAKALQKLSHEPRVFERAWMLPNYKEARESLKSRIADLDNIGFPKGYAGTITAGQFIGSFVGKTPWIHLDIAGTGMVEKRQNYLTKGGTGFGVRLLTTFLEETDFRKFKKKGKK